MLAQPTNNQKFFDTDKILVSKTDLKGKIRYANKEFLDIVGLSEEEVIGKPHNIIRHPDMPRVIFKYLWEFLHQELEINAYVKNLCADGGYYWVCANVTPSFDVQGKVIGYHSARRAPTKEALDVIIALYEKLLSLEKSGGMQASETYMQDLLNEKGVQYDEFILSI